MSETLGCGHPDKNRACGDCLDEAEAEVQRLERQLSKLQVVAQASLDQLGEAARDRDVALRLNGEMRNALNKIHDLAGQVAGSDFINTQMGAIQDWCHRVTEPCAEKPKHEGGGLHLTKTLVCRELVDWGHGDVFECGNPLPCTNPIHANNQQNEKRNDAIPVCPNCGVLGDGRKCKCGRFPS